MTARTLVPGVAEGRVLTLAHPLSFWGGMDPETGRVIDPHHPQHGATLTGTILVMPAGRGSSSSSSVLAEAIRAGTAPAAILLETLDPLVALGAVVSDELYERTCPVVLLEGPPPADGAFVRVEAGRASARIEPA